MRTEAQQWEHLYNKASNERADLYFILQRAKAFIGDVVEGKDWEGCAGREIIIEADAALRQAERTLQNAFK